MTDGTAKTIFITGAGSGIGRATAILFAGRGWRVGLADVNATGVAETAELLPAGLSETYVMDVRDRDAWDRALAAFVAGSGGRLDVLFNNAGIPAGGPYGEISADELDRIIGVNFSGVMYGARAAYPYLKAAGGCLLNTSSASGIYGSSGLAAYSATKFAVRGLSEALDGEWSAEGIRVRVLMPGFIETPLLDHAVSGSNQSVREKVAAMGLEFTPVAAVAQAAWDAVHSERLHWYIGKTAKRLAFAARWMPGSLRKRMRAAARQA